MANVSELIVPQQEATVLLAPGVVASQLQIGAWGISFASFARYLMSERFTSDPRWSRYYVSFIMLLNTIVTGMVMVSGVHLAVAQHRDPQWFAANTASLIDEIWSAIAMPMGILTRAFLARQTYLFTALSSEVYARSFVGVMIFLSALEVFGFSAGHTKHAEEIAHAPGRQPPSAWLTAHAFTIGLFAAAAADIAISGTFAWQWHRFLKDNQEFKDETDTNRQLRPILRRTDTLLKNLTSFTLATASYTAVFATIAAILWAAVPGTYWLIFATPFSGMYALSLFTTLNYQAFLKARQSNTPVLASIQVHSRSRPSQRAGSPNAEDNEGDEKPDVIHMTKDIDRQGRESV